MKARIGGYPSRHMSTPRRIRRLNRRVRIYRWVLQAIEESDQAISKMHDLISGLDCNKELWSEISEHMADTTCLIRNMLSEIPKPPMPKETNWKELLMQEVQDRERLLQTWDMFGGTNTQEVANA